MKALTEEAPADEVLKPSKPTATCDFYVRNPPQLIARLNVVLNQKLFCATCALSPVRFVRNDDDTVRHLNGELCKRFHP